MNEAKIEFQKWFYSSLSQPKLPDKPVYSFTSLKIVAEAAFNEGRNHPLTKAELRAENLKKADNNEGDKNNE